MRHIPVVLLAAWGFGGVALAQNTPPALPPLAAQVRSGQAVEQFLADVMRPLREIDVDGSGITAAELDERDAAARAGVLSSQLAAVFRYDLDNDGQVTRDEVAKAASQRRPGQAASADAVQRTIDQAMRLDADGNGIITFDEARALTEPERWTRGTQAARALLALDPDQDGRVTAAEIEQLARAAFGAIDKDGNGIISPEEFRVVQLVRNIAANEERAGGRLTCDLPKPSDSARLVAFGVYEGEAISTVAVAGQDRETSAARLVVQPGPEALYVVLSSDDAMVWQVEGAIERIERLVLLSSAEGVGATGVAREKLIFPARRTCLRAFYQPGAIEGTVARRNLEQALGRPLDAFGGSYRVSRLLVPEARAEASERRGGIQASGFETVILPGGRVLHPDGDTLVIGSDGTVAPPPPGLPAPEGTEPAIWQTLLRFYPGGIATIDPAAVIASGRAEAYAVLPQQAGLAQLLREGSLERIDSRGRDSFRIVKPIARFPAGLNGAHSVQFLLAKGVPMPAGSPGHSQVTSEETGEVCRPGRPC